MSEIECFVRIGFSDMVTGNNQQIHLKISKEAWLFRPVVLTEVDTLFNIILDYVYMLKLLQIYTFKYLVWSFSVFHTLQEVSCAEH